MDDEDMGDFGIAPQKIQNAAKFRKEKDDLGKVMYPKYCQFWPYTLASTILLSYFDPQKYILQSKLTVFSLSC